MVEQMIRVAAGQKLLLTQSDVKINGWAFESRVYAEDPKLFLPSIGRLGKYVEPLEDGNPEIRCDSGIKEGSEISIYYDPLICKLCTHGPDRATSLATMQRALDSYVIRGVTHNIPLIREVLSQKRFQEGRITTKYLSEEFPNGFQGHKLEDEEAILLSLVAAYVYNRSRKRIYHGKLGDSNNEEFIVKIDGVEKKVRLVMNKDANKLMIGNRSYKVESTWNWGSPRLEIHIDGKPHTLQYHGSPHLGRIALQSWGTVYNLTVQSPLEHDLSQYVRERSLSDSERIIKAPMAGQIVSVTVSEGDTVREGAEIAVIEAMKMQNVLRAPKAGRIKSVSVKEGENVSAEQKLVELEFL